MINIDRALGSHAQALPIWEKKLEIRSNNLTNMDTPGFKARDFDFVDQLNKTLKKQYATLLTKTNEKHLGSTGPLSSMDLKYIVPSQPRLDGNTVDPDIEKAKFSEESTRYLVSLNFLNGNIRNLTTAIRGE